MLLSKRTGWGLESFFKNWTGEFTYASDCHLAGMKMISSYGILWEVLWFLALHWGSGMDTPLTTLSLLFPPAKKRLVVYMLLSSKYHWLTIHAKWSLPFSFVSKETRSGPTARGMPLPDSIWSWTTQHPSMGYFVCIMLFTKHGIPRSLLSSLLNLQCVMVVMAKIIWWYLQDKSQQAPQEGMHWQCHSVCTWHLMLTAVWKTLDVEVFLYSAGFPCKAFSALHANTRLLLEEEAKPMYRVLQNTVACAPPVAWLWVRGKGTTLQLQVCEC